VDPWSFAHVVDADVPAFAARTYREHADLRAHLRRLTDGRPLSSACELGCGYGRMIPVLGEFAVRVVGFERQPEFLDAAKRLHPNVHFEPLSSIGSVPAPDGAFDLALAFTVLQHLTDRMVAAAAAELRRVVRPGGWVLLCEDTNPANRHGAVDDDNGMCVIGRAVQAYAALLAPCRLVSVAPRRVEPTYPTADVGSYMLFAR
jgi:SAM-dependent methyltransferase